MTSASSAEKTSSEGYHQQTPAEQPQESASAPESPDEPPPNGGLKAWLQVLGSFLLFFNTWGIANSFGVYQTYYAAELLKHETESSISWVGSIQSFLLLAGGVAAGPLFDAGYFRTLLYIGAFLVTFGMFMTSLCTQYWQVLLAHGVTVGLGNGCLFVPSVALVSTYFTTKKSFATGIASSGSSVGGVVYPIIFARLTPQLGFAWATRVIAFIMLATLAVCAAVMRVRQPHPRQRDRRHRRRLLDLSALREAPFIAFSVAELLGFMAFYIPYFYIQSYAVATGAMTPGLAFYTVAILNAAAVFGRVIPNLLADALGPLNILIPCGAVSAALAFCWIAVGSSAGGVVAFCVLYGFFSGTFVSLPPVTVVSLTPRADVVGTRMGMSFAFAAVGVLIGNPIAGAVLRSGGGGGWLGVQLFCGVGAAAATLACVVARWAKAPALLSKV